jgi:hypothetical protein
MIREEPIFTGWMKLRVACVGAPHNMRGIPAFCYEIEAKRSGQETHGLKLVSREMPVRLLFL